MTLPANAFVQAVICSMLEPGHIRGIKDRDFIDGLAASLAMKLARQMEQTEVISEEESCRREEVVRALCACRHRRASLFKALVERTRDTHKRWPERRWNVEQNQRLLFLLTAYRDQLGDHRPALPIPDLHNPGRYLGQELTAPSRPERERSPYFITWTSQYRPWETVQ